VSPQKGSLPAYLLGEEVAQALVNAGMPIEQLKQLKTRPDVAEAIVKLAHRMLYPNETVLDIDFQVELSTPLEDSGLARREFNPLIRAGLLTVGDLTIVSKIELRAERNIGDKAIRHIEQMLATHGLQLRNQENDPFLCAARLYKSRELIPARLMPLWVSLLEYVPRMYLTGFGTLKAVSLSTRSEFMQNYLKYGSTVVQGERQADRVEQGLARAGLAFRAETE